MKNIVKVKNLSIDFSIRNGVFRAVDEISFNIETNKTLALVGESGSGKSVTAMSLMQLLPIPQASYTDNSSIFFEDKEIIGASNADLLSIRGNLVSMIFQEPMTSLNPYHRVGDQITESILLHSKKNKAEAKKEAINLMQQVEIDDVERRFLAYPHELSGGQRQRIMIAMALVNKPKLLIADEPTTALDVTIQAQILDLMTKLKKEFGMSILFITHDLGLVREFSDKVCVMQNGKIVEQGDTKQVFENPQHQYTKKLLDAEPIPYELDESKGWLPDLEKLDKSDMSKVKLMWLNYPHMPTGSEANDKFYKKIILFAKKNNVLLINDNPYSFILTKKPKSFLSHEGALDVGMELNSLSKSFNMAGWRVGMLLGNSSNIKSVIKVKSNIDSGMFYGIQKGAITALNQSTKWFTSLNKVYNDRREIAWKIADKLNTTYNKNSVGLFVWARIQENIDNVDLLVDELLYKKNIFITPGKVFGSKGNRYIRISLCTKQIFLNEALNRL